ncbi:Trehalose utilization, partial [Durusdinium trenchii]
MTHRSIPIAALLMALATMSHNARSSAAEPLKGLLITGGCCHDYGNQKTIITEGLSQRLNIEFDVVHEGGTSRDHKVSVYEDPNWAKKYDVIIHNECFGAVVDPKFVKSITSAHFAGVPGVFIHCSLHSYRNSGAADAWRELIGVTSRSHERHRALAVRKLDVSHPVLTEFPSEWKTPNGELYKIEQVWPNCTPLAIAYGADTDKDHVVAWVNRFGDAKVFGTSLGHHNETMNNDIWLGLVSRGVLWVCDKLDDSGAPIEGYEGSGIKPIEADKRRREKMAREDDIALLHEYVESESLRRHMYAVEVAMRAYAKKFGEDEAVWGTVGLLHDFDYEKWPDPPDHPLKGSEILAQRGYSQEIIYAIKSHADYLEDCPRLSRLDKTLYACDELAGFITACALVRPQRIEGLTAKSVKKKMKQASFAAAVNREDIVRGAEDLGVDLTEHMTFVIEAMQSIADEL